MFRLISRSNKRAQPFVEEKLVMGGKRIPDPTVVYKQIDLCIEYIWLIISSLVIHVSLSLLNKK